MTSSAVSNVCIALSLISILLHQQIPPVQAGSCFNQRTNDLCYDLTEMDTDEEQCTGIFYSEDILQDLDGYIYAEKCRNVQKEAAAVGAKRCDADCGLGQECQWIDGEEMCVCSDAACQELNLAEEPICASNNMTFTSPCAMEAWKCFNGQSALYKRYDGQCKKDCQHVQCPHNKICLLVKNTGEPMCYPKAHCDTTLDPEPVCATNGRTYSNICTMRLNADQYGRTPDLAHKGPCVNECRSDLCESHERCVYSNHSRPTCIQCAFPRDFLQQSGECSTNVPVCAENGLAYKNYCFLLLDQCKRSRSIQIIDYGTCPVRKRKKILRKNFHSMNQLKSF